MRRTERGGKEGERKGGRKNNRGRTEEGRREVLYLYLGSLNTVPPFSSSFLSC